ncbi:MAG: glycosyltransferase [Phycisphaerales bacterium]|nr:MAG: glycosyltransferase [Phycisphaerales bacterium]
MCITVPRLTVGLPVYNGARFVGKAIESILAQTFMDLELDISDNASTDETEEICRRYTEKDKRVHYDRNEKNIGAAPNYNRLFEASKSEYFKWAAHDDALAPEYLMQCVKVLDSDPSVAVCHTDTVYVDPETQQTLEQYDGYDDLLDLRSPEPHVRFGNYLFRPHKGPIRWNAIFGVMRASVLARTPLIGAYVLSDQVLLGELALLGKIYRVPEKLFIRGNPYSEVPREKKTYTTRTYAIWFDPRNRGKIILPKNLRAVFEYLRSIRRVRLCPNERTWCYLYMVRWSYLHLLLIPFENISKRVVRVLRRLWLRLAVQP